MLSFYMIVVHWFACIWWVNNIFLFPGLSGLYVKFVKSAIVEVFSRGSRPGSMLLLYSNQQKESITVFNQRVGRAMDKSFFCIRYRLQVSCWLMFPAFFSRGSRMGSRLRFPDFDRNLLILIGRYVQIVFDFPSENKTEFQLL